MLATELRLHGVRVLVLEKDEEPASYVRIVSLHIRSLEDFRHQLRATVGTDFGVHSPWFGTPA